MTVKIKKGGKPHHFTNYDQIDSINIVANNDHFEMWKEDTCLIHLTIGEVLGLKNTIQDEICKLAKIKIMWDKSLVNLDGSFSSISLGRKISDVLLHEAPFNLSGPDKKHIYLLVNTIESGESIDYVDYNFIIHMIGKAESLGIWMAGQILALLEKNRDMDMGASIDMGAYPST